MLPNVYSPKAQKALRKLNKMFNDKMLIVLIGVTFDSELRTNSTVYQVV